MYKLKLIKAIVFIMTFLIVFGSFALITVMFKSKISKNDTPAEKEINLAEPSGSSIHSILEKDEKLYILIKNGGSPDRIIIFDTNKGIQVSKITLY